MGTQFTISELAHKAGVPTSTVRYYERAGLLSPDNRSEGNYRLYGQGTLERLRFIRAAQATGFTLEDIGTLLSHDHDPGLCCDVQGLIRERLADVKRRMDDLRHIRSVLEATLKRCLKSEPTGLCDAVESLVAEAHTPSLKSPRRRIRKNP